MGELFIEISHGDPSETSVRLVGDFQGTSVAAHEDELIRELSLTKKRLVLNMREVPYLDSYGLGFIFHCSRKAKDQKKELVILAPSENVLKILRMTSMDDKLNIVRA